MALEVTGSTPVARPKRPIRLGRSGVAQVRLSQPRVDPGRAAGRRARLASGSARPVGRASPASRARNPSQAHPNPGRLPVTQLTKSGGTPSSVCSAQCSPAPEAAAGLARRVVKEQLRDEGPGRRQARRRLQRQDPGQDRWLRGRDRQRQDVDEPVRRDRQRGGDPAQGERPGRGGGRGLARRGEVPGDLAHRARDGRRPRDPRPDRCRAAAARGRQAAQGGGGARAARPDHPGQAGDRRRQQPDRADAGRAARLAPGHLRLQARVRGRRAHGSPARSTPASRR